MGKRRPVRKLRISAYVVPPGYDEKSGRRPNHGQPTRHHLVPRSQGGQTTPANLLEVPEKVHQAWHYLFGNRTPEQVMGYIATHWVPAGYFDLIVLRQGSREIRLDRATLLQLLDEPPDRPNTPSFRDRTGFVRSIYLRHRRRRRSNH